MFEHIIGLSRPKAMVSRQTTFDGTTSISEHREKVLESITACETFSRRGLWGILLFIALSGFALQLRGVDLFAGMPEAVRCLLGTAPPVGLIHLVLGISTVSSLIIIFGRTTDDDLPDGSWTRLFTGLGFRSVFYLFYATAASLDDNFLMVFVTGIIVLAAEHVTTWRAATKAIAEKKEHLAHIR